MIRRSCLRCGLIVLLAVLPAVAAPTSLAQQMPGDTTLFIAWPGAAALRQQVGETNLAKLAKEPQMVALRETLTELVDKMAREKSSERDLANYERVRTVLASLWEYPTAVALVKVDSRGIIPMVDAVMVVQAGQKSASIDKALDAFFESEMKDMEVQEVKIGPWAMREFRPMGQQMGRGFAVRWGVINDSFVVSLGSRALRHLVPEYAASMPAAAEEPEEGAAAKPANLAEHPFFKKALETAGGKADGPLFFLNIEQTIATLDGFQPYFYGAKIPVLGDPDGLSGALKKLALGEFQAISGAITPDGEAFKTTFFLQGKNITRQAVGQDGKYVVLWNPLPLRDEDLKLIPADASWAYIERADNAADYDNFLKLATKLEPDKKGMDTASGVIKEIERRIGMSLRDDLVASIGETTAIFDAPSNGGLFITGATILVELKDRERFDRFLRRGIDVIVEETNSKDEVSIRQATIGTHKISFVHFGEFPTGVAPAWGYADKHVVIALYPQIVAATLDRLASKDAGLPSNKEFAAQWAAMPKNSSTMGWFDTPRLLPYLHGLLLPAAQLACAGAASEGADLDISLIPPLSTFQKYFRPSMLAAATQEDGFVFVTRGTLPLEGLGVVAVGTAPLAAAVAMPALAQARSQARRTVSMSNIKQITMAMMMYSADHKGRLPENLKEIDKYLGGSAAQVLRSPVAPEGSEESYIYIPGLDPEHGRASQTMVVYEKPEHYNNEGTVAGFLDGHVEFVQKSRFDRLLKESTALAKANKAKAGPDQDKPGDKEAPEVEETEKPKARVPAATR